MIHTDGTPTIASAGSSPPRDGLQLPADGRAWRAGCEERYHLVPERDGWQLYHGRRLVASGSSLTIGGVLAAIARGEAA